MTGRIISGENMRYLYFFMELVLYGIVLLLYIPLFNRYHFHPQLEKKVEMVHKTPLWKDIFILTLFSISIMIIFIIWHQLYPNQFHHIGYFTAFLTATLVALFIFRKWINHVDLRLCFPGMLVVWILLLAFESLLLYNNAGWIYTDSTVFSFSIGPRITLILENLIFFYLFSPFMSILIFTAMSYNRSDRTAFFLTNLFIWIIGFLWEYLCIGKFNLWYMIEERSLLPFSFFDARTTIEEMLYYIPFASISVLIYLHLYYRKYQYHFGPWQHGENV
jgi:hypothetical protein